jgi:HAE1 family hydrophobic/amphiphilic exporter-1
VFATRDVVQEVERRMTLLPGVQETFSTIGSGMEERVNYATVLVKLTPKETRSLSQFDIMLMARERLADLKHLDTSVEVVPRISGGGESAAPLQYALQGSDLKALDEVADRMIARMKQVPGIVDINSTYDDGKPEANVRIDRDKASDLGISAQDLGNAIYALIGGRKVGKFEEDGETYDVRIRLAEDDRNRSDAILRVPVRTRSGKLVELGNLVDVSLSEGPVQIDREDRQRKVTIVAGLEPTLPLQGAVDAVRQIEQEIRQQGWFPDSVNGKFVGEAERMAESFASINFTLTLAVVLVYMVLAAQFESLVHPFTVMLSLPLSIVGALGLLTITGRTLNIFSMIGMIMLMGLVTKNAILLIDYTNLLRSRGLDREEALLRAGPVRLRPILMTAMSTIAGMIPVAIGLGSGAETRAPMGTCIVGGMVTSTVLTLVVIPVVYSLMDDLALRIRRLFFGAAETASPAPAAPPTPADHPPLIAAQTVSDMPSGVETVQLVRDDYARN